MSGVPYGKDTQLNSYQAEGSCASEGAPFEQMIVRTLYIIVGPGPEDPRASPGCQLYGKTDCPQKRDRLIERLLCIVAAFTCNTE